MSHLGTWDVSSGLNPVPLMCLAKMDVDGPRESVYNIPTLLLESFASRLPSSPFLKQIHLGTNFLIQFSITFFIVEHNACINRLNINMYFEYINC